jgi:hypothetical protein
VVPKALVDQIDHFARDRIGRHQERRRHVLRTGLAEALAVVGVEIPLAARRLLAVHQHAVFLPQLAVPVFEPQLLAAFGVGGKVAHGAEEVRVVAQIQRQMGLRRHGAQGLQHAPVAGGGQQQLLRPEGTDGAMQFTGQRADVVRIVNPGVVQRQATLTQLGREVPHGGKEDGDALFRRPDVCGFFGHLGHPHHILRGVEALQCAAVVVQLVAQHDDQVANACGGHLRFSRRWCFCARGRRRSSTSPCPSFLPRPCASSWAGRRPHRVCWADGPCCL